MKGTAKIVAKKSSIFKRMNKGIKEIISELKKVSWPTAGKLIKQTGVVLVVVLFFLLIVLGIDSLLSWLLGLLVTVN